MFNRNWLSLFCAALCLALFAFTSGVQAQGAKRGLVKVAGDVETLGTLGIGDAIFVLNFLFLGTTPPPPPYPDCGPAGPVDDSGCVRGGC